MTGPELQELRHSAGLSASKLAQRLKVHERTIYKWEHGERKINHFVEEAILRLTLGTLIKDVIEQV